MNPGARWSACADVMPGSVSGPSSLRPASRAASTPAATVRPASPRPRKPGRACSRFISPMRSSRRLSATHPGASPSTCATSSRPCDGSRGGASAANSARGALWPRPSMLASGGARCSLHVRLDESSGRGERTDHDVVSGGFAQSELARARVRIHVRLLFQGRNQSAGSRQRLGKIVDAEEAGAVRFQAVSGPGWSGAGVRGRPIDAGKAASSRPCRGFARSNRGPDSLPVDRTATDTTRSCGQRRRHR